jgi:hypothetical protein
MRKFNFVIAIPILMAMTFACKTVEKQEVNSQNAKQEAVQKPASFKPPITKPLPPIKADKATMATFKLKSDGSGDSLFASIKRTPCYGRCPIYEAKIFSSGFVLYEGKRFVEKEGIFTTWLSEEQLQQITDKANELQFFDLEVEYDSPVTDLPTTYTFIRNGAITKQVKNRVGGPDNLKAYESFLEGMLDAANWKKKSDVNH